jgi:hypothetical protein
MKNRFGELAALTRGAAVVTLGLGAMSTLDGCTKKEASSQAPVAAGSSTEADSADASPAAAGVRPRRRFPIPNAMHPGWRFPDAGPSNGGADGSSGP